MCSTMDKIILTDCKNYIEDWTVCDDMGEPKGQCSNCGAKWYEHSIEFLSGADKESAVILQKEYGVVS